MKLICALLICVAAPAVAGEKWPLEPNAYRGIAFGAPEKEVRQALKKLGAFDCFGPRNDQTCVSYTSPVFEQEVYSFDGDRHVLVVIDAIFRSEEFERVRATLVERYGEPTSTREEQVTTRAGAVLTNVLMRWEGDAVTLDLRRFGGDIEHGAAMLATSDWTRKLAEEEAARKKKAASGL